MGLYKKESLRESKAVCKVDNDEDECNGSVEEKSEES